MPKKIEPLSNVRPYWEHGEEGYPDKIRLAMSDGKIVTYRLEVVQPKPTLFFKPWKPIFIRHQPTYYLGEYYPKHLKKTGGAATPTGK